MNNTLNGLYNLLLSLWIGGISIFTFLIAPVIFKSFDRDMEDIFALYSDVAQAITKEIQIAITPEEINRIKTTKKANPEAVEAFLRGN